MTWLTQHYGIDWLAVALTMLAIWQLGNRKRVGFLVMIFGNVGWMILALRVQNMAMIVANVIFFAMNVRGYIKWLRRDKLELAAADKPDALLRQP